MREDQTALCVQCGLRQSPAAQCRRCGRAPRDLSDAASRRDALEAWRARYVAKRTRALYRSAKSAKRGLLQFLIGAGVVALPIAFMALGSPIALLLPAALFASCAAIGFAWYGLWPRSLLASSERGTLDVEVRELAASFVAPIELHDPPETSGGTTIEGRVVAIDTMDPPFGGGRAVAWRVAGEAPGGRIDEGGARDFELVTDGGERIRVEAGGSVFTRLDPSRPAPLELTPEQASYLDARGAQTEHGEVRLQVMVLREGDRAAVTGTIDERAVPDGYRGTRTGRVVSGAARIIGITASSPDAGEAREHDEEVLAGGAPKLERRG
jgi:hypothetical protein